MAATSSNISIQEATLLNNEPIAMSVQYEKRTGGTLSRWKSIDPRSSTKVLIAFEPIRDTLPELSPRQYLTLTREENVQTVNNFLTDDNGTPILSDQSKEASELPTHIGPLRRIMTNDSTSSRWTLTDFMGLQIPLERLTLLIEKHRALQRIKILSTEGYKQTRNGVLHRFLVLELERHHGSDTTRTIWLRLDRRMDQSVGTLKFLLASGVTPANDTVMFSANKNDLTKGAKFESRQVFEQWKTLDDLGRLLRVICEELVVYEIWPANCWFFVSLLQQHLQGEETGCFKDGTVQWGNTAQAVRSRVKERLRLIYHIPQPFTVLDALFFLQQETISFPNIQGLVIRALKCSSWVASHRVPNSVSPASGLETADSLHQIALQVDPLQHFNTAMVIRKQGIDITRDLLQRSKFPRKKPESPTNNFGVGYAEISARLALYLSSMSDILNDAQRFSDAVEVDQEAVKLRRELFETNPDLHRADLASSLYNLGISLDNAHCDGDALEVKQEAVKLRRELFEANPDLYRSDLARSLNNLGVSLDKVHRYSDALKVMEEAMKLRRELFETNPDLHRANLANTLHDLGVSLDKVHRYGDALEHRREAMKLRRELFEANSDLYRADLATGLHNLGVSLDNLHRYGDALEVQQEAVKLQRQLFEADPNMHRAHLSLFLEGLAFSLRLTNRIADAEAARNEANALADPPTPEDVS